MHTWSAKPALAATLVAGTLALTSCSAINPQETKSIVAAVPGVRGEVGPLRLEDLVVVSGGGSGSATLDPKAPGRLAGTVFNGSPSPVPVSFATQDSSPVQVTVPPNGKLMLGAAPRVRPLNRTDGIPGGMTTVTIHAGNSALELKVPVVDGTLAQYRPYLPSPTPTGSNPPPRPATTSGGVTTPSPTATATETGRPSAPLSIAPSH